MPNHCENDLYVTGPKVDVAALLAATKADQPESEFDFEAVIPYPERFATMDLESCAFDPFRGGNIDDEAAREAYRAKYGTEKDGFNSGGYQWCVDNWGTKWNAYRVSVKLNRDGVCIHFDTAWAPPIPVIKAFAKKYPSLTFRLKYFERGYAFQGVFEARGEEELVEERQPYHGQRGG